MNVALTILLIQGLLGATDTLWYHEFRLGLAAQPSQRFELRLHAIRTFIYTVLYSMLALAEWRGAWAGLVAVLLATEIFITMWDFIEEDRTRVLPAGERVMHGVLAILYGAFLALFLPILHTWWQSPAAVSLVYRPLISSVLLVMALGAAGSGVRDFWASRALNEGGVS